MSGSMRSVDCAYPDDPTQCRITFTTSVQQPLIAWTPVYNGVGMMTNSDPNTHIRTYTCTTCNSTWEVASTAGSDQVARMVPPEPPTMEQSFGASAGTEETQSFQQTEDPGEPEEEHPPVVGSLDVKQGPQGIG